MHHRKPLTHKAKAPKVLISDRRESMEKGTLNHLENQLCTDLGENLTICHLGERPESSQTGASAKAHAAKARPDTSRPQPPDPPPSRRMQEERREDTTYAEDQDTTNDPGQSSQQPIDPTWNERGRGRGRGRHWERDDRWSHRGRGRKRISKTIPWRMGIPRVLLRVSISLKRTSESRAQRRFHQACVHP